MPNTPKLPDRATLAEHCAAGMTIDQIAGAYDCLAETVRRKLQRFGLVQVKPKSLPVELAGKGRPRISQSKRGVFLHADRITFMRDTCCENGGLAVRPMSLPRISMQLQTLAKRKVNITEVRNGSAR